MSAETSLSTDLGRASALVNSLSEVLQELRGDIDGVGLSALIVADAALMALTLKLELAESDAIQLEKRLGI